MGDAAMHSLGFGHVAFDRNEHLYLRDLTPQNLPDFSHIPEILRGSSLGQSLAVFPQQSDDEVEILETQQGTGMTSETWLLSRCSMACFSPACSKVDQLKLLIRTTEDFSSPSAFWFSKTWLNDAMVERPGFSL